MQDFKTSLIKWYRENKRNLPWRKSSDPYKIWLSEVILQQTRVAQGLPYYEKFIKFYPTVFDLAKADEVEVLKLWQGLGYYSRARNLHYTAKFVADELNGIFPTSYKELIKLKGIGDYTASAISSICFDEARPVLDGNVFRVVSRCFGIDVPINTGSGKKIFKEKAEDLMDRHNPGEYNQAIMEFGALHCKPKSPFCDTCPFQNDCVAFQQGLVQKLPVKLKTIKIKKRFLNYLIFTDENNKTLINERNESDIWLKLYDFPLIETKKAIKKQELLQKEWIEINKDEIQFIELFNSKPVVHQLSHQKLHISFWLVKTKDLALLEPMGEYKKIEKDRIDEFPVPVVIDNFLKAFEF